MQQEYIDIAVHLGTALVVGSLIGMERTNSGRPAGFRTHALVCVASALLMLITNYQAMWLKTVSLEVIRTDPARMAQGIMTGIGFLGAGVIFKEGLSVRGLTTAASIWMTASIGILFGIGFYYPGLLAAGITLGILSLFRFFESKLPTRHYVRHVLRFRRDRILPEAKLRALLKRHRFSVVRIHYHLRNEGRLFEYRMIIKTLHAGNLEPLAAELLALPDVVEFHLGSIAD